MTTSHDGGPRTYTDDELAEMTPEQLVRLGTELDSVEVVHRPVRWPVPGTRAEKRAERSVALWFALALDINLLTLIVSLEAIYITLFIGLGQKLQDKRAAIEAKADKKTAEHAEAHREKLAEQQATMLRQNTDITEQIEELTEEIHKHLGIAPKPGAS